MAEALIALGGNVGDARAILAAGLASFCDGQVVRLLARSSDYRTPPWGYADQPPFINACAAVETELSPEALLERALDVERRFGRIREGAPRFGPRPLDIDLLTYGDAVLNTDALTLPHPRMLDRAFALVPLVEIRPDLVVHGRRVADVLAGLDRTGIERLG